MAITITKVEDLVKKTVTNDMKRLAQKVKASETKPAAPQRPTTPHVVQEPLPMGVTIGDCDDDYWTATPPLRPTSTSTPQPTAQTEVVAQEDTPLTETPQAEAPSEPMTQINQPKSPETEPSEIKEATITTLGDIFKRSQKEASLKEENTEEETTVETATPQPTTEADTAEAATIEVSAQTEPPTSKKKKKGKKHRKAKHKEHRLDRTAQPIEIHIHLHLP